MKGAFILAPGFTTKFAGNFGTVNGAMAADSFSFTGNAGGTVHGPIVNYSDSVFSLSGNSNLTFDRSDVPAMPPGFVLIASPANTRASASAVIPWPLSHTSRAQ